jgi:hypothetical protein
MADEAEWFRAFVERSLEQVWGVQVVQDDDGDHPFGHDRATACVTVETVEPAPVHASDIGQMFAVVHGGEGALAEPRAS